MDKKETIMVEMTLREASALLNVVGDVHARDAELSDLDKAIDKEDLSHIDWVMTRISRLQKETIEANDVL